MVYLKGIFVVKTTIMVVLLGLLLQHTTASHTRIAYKKPISGSKTNKLKDKHMKTHKTEVIEPEIAPNPEVGNVTDKTQAITTHNTSEEKEITDQSTPLILETITSRNDIIVEESKTVNEFVPTANTASTTESANLPAPCTCGIFLASQIKRGNGAVPEGKPVITNELDRHYGCNAIGQKQCQTKCLETIVQHLPNSANILCATLNRDCRKERAYLFIKNCHQQWINTNLAAGREYCCKGGQPYQCPMV